MPRNVLTHFPYINLVVFGQLLFFAFFLGVLLWVFRRRSDEVYNHLEKLPFSDQNEGQGHE